MELGRVTPPFLPRDAIVGALLEENIQIRPAFMNYGIKKQI